MQLGTFPTNAPAARSWGEHRVPFWLAVEPSHAQSTLSPPSRLTYWFPSLLPTSPSIGMGLCTHTQRQGRHQKSSPDAREGSTQLPLVLLVPHCKQLGLPLLDHP